MTFSIVAYDPQSRQWGVAVQSRFLCVGWVVPFVRFGAGAVATQARVNIRYGPTGLDHLTAGLSAEDTVRRLLSDDREPAGRQVGIVDASGRVFAHTDTACQPWAGHIVGQHYACQGNLLEGPDVVESMATAYESAPGQLADRLVAALQAGQAAGGDRRGQLAAALQVVGENQGFAGMDHRMMDLRVDDSERPIEDIFHLLQRFKRVFFRTTDHDFVPWTGETQAELRRVLALQLALSPESEVLQHPDDLREALDELARSWELPETLTDKGIDGRLWRRLGTIR